jgi:hypothetical protein
MARPLIKKKKVVAKKTKKKVEVPNIPNIPPPPPPTPPTNEGKEGDTELHLSEPIDVLLPLPLPSLPNEPELPEPITRINVSFFPIELAFIKGSGNFNGMKLCIRATKVRGVMGPKGWQDEETLSKGWIPVEYKRLPEGEVIYDMEEEQKNGA